MEIAESKLINLEQIKLMNELYRLNQKIGTVQKTIFLYQVYDPTNLQPLTNLHAIASKVIDSQINIEIIKDDSDEDSIKYYHKVDQKLLNVHKSIKVFSFQLQGQGTTNFQWEKKVQIYDDTLNGQAVRIVAIPIPQHFFKADDVTAKVLFVDNLKKEKASDTKYLSHQALLDKQKQWDIKISAKQNQFGQEEGKNHLKMFRLEALRSVLTNKTQSINLCGILEYKVKDSTSLDNVQKELANIFKFPADLLPQYILHSHPTPENIKGNVHEYVGSPDITTVFNLDKKARKMILNRGKSEELFNRNHFTRNKQISISLYSIRLSNNNPFMASAIQKFTDEWSTTVSNAIIPIGYAVASVYNSLGIKDEPNSSSTIEPNSSIYAKSKNHQLENTAKIQFSDLAKMYKQFKDFYLQDNVELKDYYTLSKLKITKLQADEEMVPSQIAELTFLFYFCKQNKKFLQKFTANENIGYENLINSLDEYIHTICELIKHINDSLLAKGLGLDRCSNIQTYLKFIKFLLNSTILIKNITNRSLAVTGNIKNFFDGLKLKQNWIIEHIISKEENIKGGQPIHYYDFLLMFIRNEKNEETGSKINDDQIADDENIGSIFVTIHKYKADQIAKRFIYDKSKVVDAVRSYCQNILKYDYLVNNKKKTFDKFEIQKKVARLLCVIGLPGEAAKIYQRLHMIEKVEECFKQVILDYSDDLKTKKIMEFAKFFEDEFSYSLADKYYQKAYCSAKTSKYRKLAQENLLECRKRQKADRNDDVAIITKYIEQKGSEDEFVKTSFTTRQKEEGEANKVEDGYSQYKRLLKKLMWDDSKRESIILDETIIDKSILE